MFVIVKKNFNKIYIDIKRLKSINLYIEYFFILLKFVSFLLFLVLFLLIFNIFMIFFKIIGYILIKFGINYYWVVGIISFNEGLFLFRVKFCRSFFGY